jgi:hypothetical protein
MSAGSSNNTEIRQLPNEAPVGAAPAQTLLPSRQLSELPKDELEALADELSLDPTLFKTRQHLVAAIHERRQLIAGMERDAMLDVVRWGRRPITATASKEQIALEISRIRSMKFSGLSHRGLLVLAQLRNANIQGDEEIPLLVRKLRRQEGMFSRVGRKWRGLLGSGVAKMIGETESEREYQYLPPAQSSSPGAAPLPPADPSRQGSIKEDIEEAGLLTGLTNRIKKTADSYLNQKLDEVEMRIDRKLEEIDRRLAEWRDKEIANRIRIMKITLWASVIVAIVSLMYAYLRVYLPQIMGK